ncbi:hypothetical protein F4604DRAFT_1684502 [Suillus subluteus]|nr:hypothetical protein F4604DRAFT_1684502 [Suillus subluteus]
MHDPKKEERRRPAPMQSCTNQGKGKAPTCTMQRRGASSWVKAVKCSSNEGIQGNGPNSVWPRTLNSLWLKSRQTQQTEKLIFDRYWLDAEMFCRTRKAPEYDVYRDKTRQILNSKKTIEREMKERCVSLKSAYLLSSELLLVVWEHSAVSNMQDDLRVRPEVTISLEVLDPICVRTPPEDDQPIDHPFQRSRSRWHRLYASKQRCRIVTTIATVFITAHDSVPFFTNIWYTTLLDRLYGNFIAVVMSGIDVNSPGIQRHPVDNLTQVTVFHLAVVRHFPIDQSTALTDPLDTTASSASPLKLFPVWWLRLRMRRVVA